MKPKQYSDEDLLAHLCELADGETAPTAAEVAQADGPHSKTYTYRFGSYSAAVEQAGLEARPRGGRYTKSELLKHLRELADGRSAPTTSEIKRANGPHPDTYKLRFGSYSAAAEQAGLDAGARGERYTDAELLDWLRAFVAEFWRTPRAADANDWPGPTAETYRRRFGSWAAAIREAGFEPVGVCDE